MAGSFKARTSYVADRLRTTSWANRAIIRDLLSLEDLYLGQWGCGMHLLWLQTGLARRRPVEAYIIRHEIRTGLRISEAEAEKRIAQDAAAQKAREEALKARQAAEQEQRDREAYQAWLQAGGLP